MNLGRLFAALRRVERSMEELRRATATPVHESESLPFDGELAAAGPGNGARFASRELPCSGCAHSASGAPFPGFPSGERPCGFCVRNPEHTPERPVSDWFGERGPRWYDGKLPPYRTPMDCYIATDRFTQQRIFDALDWYERKGESIPARERFERHPLSGDPGETWCCEGGDGPEGHTWTCWRWLGMSFG